MDIHLVQNKIYTIRGQKVMLDFDLAEMYKVETKYLKRSVRANIKRFPSDFMFELTKNEWECLRCNFSTSNLRGGIRYTPFVFTELGVAMLSSILNSDIAIEINIGIMRAFVTLRQLVVSHPNEKVEELRQYVEDMFTDQNDINEDTRMQLELINLSLAELQAGKRLSDYPRRRIGFIREEE
jgi:hypothetical protein